MTWQRRYCSSPWPRASSPVRSSLSTEAWGFEISRRFLYRAEFRFFHEKALDFTLAPVAAVRLRTKPSRGRRARNPDMERWRPLGQRRHRQYRRLEPGIQVRLDPDSSARPRIPEGPFRGGSRRGPRLYGVSAR